jgi:hypothetical protein
LTYPFATGHFRCNAPKTIALRSGSEREMAQKLTSDIDQVRCLSWVNRVVLTVGQPLPVYP